MIYAVAAACFLFGLLVAKRPCSGMRQCELDDFCLCHKGLTCSSSIQAEILSEEEQVAKAFWSQLQELKIILDSAPLSESTANYCKSKVGEMIRYTREARMLDRIRELEQREDKLIESAKLEERERILKALPEIREARCTCFAEGSCFCDDGFADAGFNECLSEVKALLSKPKE